MRTPFRKSHGKITFVLYNKPYKCGGNCIYCFKTPGLTKSTTKNEDTELAKNCNWNGAKQIAKRFDLYNLNNSNGIKCDLAVKGDSFASHNPNYLKSYVKEIYDFLNKSNSSSLKEAAYIQRSGLNRCVTFKIETRPDHISIYTCKLFLELGVTTVELGVQNTNDSVLEINKRGHSIKTIIKATKLLRTFGFEVVYQIMIGLPGSNTDLDKLMLTNKLWEDQFSPDALKIYPCLLLSKDVTNQKELHDYYLKGQWNPIRSEEYIKLLYECYPKIPRYVHINRIQRVIPPEKIEAGVNIKINRNIFFNASNCLWQRSVAQNITDLESDFQNYKIINCIQGNNRFCFEVIYSSDIVLGYSRLDIISEDSALVRDIRILGNMLPIGDKNLNKLGCQHTGMGKSLLYSMENFVKKRNLKYIFIKPSFGTIDWFEKHGYKNVGVYYWGKNLFPDLINAIELPDILKDVI